MRRRILLLTGGVALAATLAMPAAAHDKAFKSKVTLQVENDFTWHGRVKSASRRCVANRQVKLYTTSGKLVGDPKTDADGRWSWVLIGDRYYARVTRDVRGGRGHRHVCKADRSPTKSAPKKP